jgi:DivIVA domain-containing protein
VALDRQSIEKKDFPIGRRGYDPDAVDAHLNSLADEVEELRSAARRRGESLAEAAADQVRSIVEAAETSANQIRADADKDARDIRREARAEAKQSREEATAQAGEYVANVSAATRTTLERLDAIEQEVSSLLEGLRTGAGRANSDLQLLENHLVEIRDAVSPRPVFEPEEPEAFEEPIATTYEPPAASYESAEPTISEAPADEDFYDNGSGELVELPVEAAGGSAEPDFGDDTEGARLIALNMALNGTPREEVDRYLAENFDLTDRAGLIEEVYTSVEG